MSRFSHTLMHNSSISKTVPHIFQIARLNMTIGDTEMPKFLCTMKTLLVHEQFSWPDDWRTVSPLAAFANVPTGKITFFKSNLCTLFFFNEFLPLVNPVDVYNMQRLPNRCRQNTTVKVFCFYRWLPFYYRLRLSDHPFVSYKTTTRDRNLPELITENVRSRHWNSESTCARRISNGEKINPSERIVFR